MSYPPPTEGALLIRKCRQHFHVACLWPPYDEGDGFDPVDISGCLTFEQASRSMLTPLVPA